MLKNLKKSWYIVRVISGFEEKVVNSLKKYIKFYGLERSFKDIIIPTEKIVDFSKGKKKTSKRKFFPGYFLVLMTMNNENWHIVKNIPHVLGFIGGVPGYPSSVKKKEIQFILHRLKKISKKPRPKILFKLGESIRINDGPFSEFNGIVEYVDYEKNRLKISVSIFGRSTPIELNFNQVEKK